MEIIALKLLKNWSSFKKGDIIYPKREITPLLIERLIKKGIVKRYEKGEKE
jgi:hypothetical protein